MDHVIELSDSESDGGRDDLIARELVGYTADLIGDDSFEFPEVEFHYVKDEPKTNSKNSASSSNSWGTNENNFLSSEFPDANSHYKNNEPGTSSASGSNSWGTNENNFFSREFPDANSHYKNNEPGTSSASGSNSWRTNENNFLSRENSDLTSESSQNSAIDSAKDKKLQKLKIASEKKAERERKKEEVARKKEEAARKKEEVARKKAEKAVLNKNVKSLKPEESLKSMQLVIDQHLTTQQFYNKLIAHLQSQEVNFTVDSELIPFSISWKREAEKHFVNGNGQVSSQTFTIDENHLLVIWSWEDVVEKMANSTLVESVGQIVDFLPQKRIHLFIFGIQGYFSYQKNSVNGDFRVGVETELGKTATIRNLNRNDRIYGSLPKISQNDLEVNLCEIQLRYNCSSRLIKTQDELNLAVFQFTKAIAAAPYKEEANKNREIAGDSRGAVTVDNNGNGLKRLWQQQLCQFNSCTLAHAESICQRYGSPRQLMDAYSKCTPTEGEALLKDIDIRRAAGPVTQHRKIGPELSKTFYKMFTSEDGNLLLRTGSDNKKKKKK